MNLDEALARGLQATESARARIGESAGHWDQALDDEFRRQAWWRRWAVRRFHEAAKKRCSEQAGELSRGLFDSLLDGYRLTQNRLQKAMIAAELERIACVGAAVDPHEMTVVATVRDSNLVPGTVVAEVRRGYRWKGKVVRFAEVQAVSEERNT
jgi:hypothetical protein